MSSKTKEVITLQLGHYANYVGAHWWNIQESSFVYDPSADAVVKEIDHDVMFREGRTLNGDVTYTPRLIALDLKGSVLHLKQDGCLYDVESELEQNVWEGNVSLHKEEAAEKNEFLKALEDGDVVMDMAAGAGDGPIFGPAKLYNLDNCIQSWSDYLRIHFHPQSLHIINKYQHSNELDKFDIYGAGSALLNDSQEATNIEDKLHFFLEDCDQLQGFHILVDTYNGFGGICGSLLELLQDECPNRALATFPLYPAAFDSSTGAENLYRLVNSALAFDKLSSHSSFLAPMSMASSLWRKPSPPLVFPHLKYKADLAYHSSAVLAGALDTLSLPYRRTGDGIHMNHMASALTPLSRKVLAVHSCFPFALQDNKMLVDKFMEVGDQLLWQPLTPYCTQGEVPTAQSVVMRGVSESRVMRERREHLPPQLSNCRTAGDLLELYLSEVCPSSLNAGCVLQSKMKTLAPYPHIFSPNLTESGDLSATPRLANRGVGEVGVATSLQNSASTANIVKQLHELASKVDIRKYHRFMDHGLEEEEFKETVNNLVTLASNYEDITEGLFS